MAIENLKSYLRGNVTFKYYKDSSLWYETSNNFLFPVPISDIGSATFLDTDIAMLFMRYIRKHLETIQEKEDV